MSETQVAGADHGVDLSPPATSPQRVRFVLRSGRMVHGVVHVDPVVELRVSDKLNYDERSFVAVTDARVSLPDGEEVTGATVLVAVREVELVEVEEDAAATAVVP